MSALRLYPLKGAILNPATIGISTKRGNWSNLAPGTFSLLARAKGDQPATGTQEQFLFGNGTPGIGQPQFVFYYLFDADTTIDGTFDVGFRVWVGTQGTDAGAAAVDAHWHIHAYVSEGTTGNVRGTILSNYQDPTGANYFPHASAAAGRQFIAPASLTPVNALAGDYLIVETGYVFYPAPANDACYERFGTKDSGGALLDDIASGDSNGAAWIEIAFSTPPAPNRCSGGTVPSSPGDFPVFD